jgi:hypothetical protein
MDRFCGFVIEQPILVTRASGIAAVGHERSFLDFLRTGQIDRMRPRPGGEASTVAARVVAGNCNP